MADTRRTRFSLAAITILLVVSVAGCNSGPSDRELAEKIKSKESILTSVQITERMQSYVDSFRSPGDAGNTYVVRARVTSSRGITEDRVYKIFIAKSDGWVNVSRQ